MSHCSHYYVQVVCSAHSTHSIMPGYASCGPPCPQQPSWRFLSCSNAGSVNRDRRHVNAACEVFDTSQQHPTIAVRILASSLSACSPRWLPCTVRPFAVGCRTRLGIHSTSIPGDLRFGKTLQLRGIFSESSRSRDSHIFGV